MFTVYSIAERQNIISHLTHLNTPASYRYRHTPHPHNGDNGAKNSSTLVHIKDAEDCRCQWWKPEEASEANRRWEEAAERNIERYIGEDSTRRGRYAERSRPANTFFLPRIQFDSIVMITMETAIPAVIVFVSTGWQMMAKTTMVEKKMKMMHNQTMSSKMKTKMRQSQDWQWFNKRNHT